MLNTLFASADTRISKCKENLSNELSKIRTGRAHPQILDQIKVSSYGSEMPLSQVASVHVEGTRNLLVTPWDKSQINACEKAIRQSDLDLNPAIQGNSIRVPFPVLTEERRKDLVKIVKEQGEAGKVAIRNVRRSILQDIKTMLKDKEITEDEEKSAANKMNVKTQDAVAAIDKIIASKEVELSEV
jgi:ribosome recycling factor|tara:strand:+ start:406 stop:963 length:558 start_codon:yes stop_codon:yes gene_type:complete